MYLSGKTPQMTQVLNEKYKVIDIIPSCISDDFIDRNLCQAPTWILTTDVYEYQCYMAAIHALPRHGFFYLLAAVDIYHLVQKSPKTMKLPPIFPTETVENHTRLLTPFKMNFYWYLDRHALIRALYDYLLICEHTGFGYLIQTEGRDIQILVDMYGSWRYPSCEKLVYAESSYALTKGDNARSIRTIFAESYPRVDFQASNSVAITSPSFYAEKRITLQPQCKNEQSHCKSRTRS